MKSTYVGTRSANVGDIRCSFAPASDSTNNLTIQMKIKMGEVLKLHNF